MGRLLYRSLSYFLVRPRSRPWQETDVPGVRKRAFRDYDSYLRVQRSKLKLLNLSAYDEKFSSALEARLATLGLDLAGIPVLCLAARSGAEVRAFQRRGAFAVGIDLNPGEDNRLVLPGDFHALQFPDGSAGVVYCNSLDHAFDLDAVLGEVHRVLAPGGHFLMEVMRGEEEGNEFGRWEASSWDSPEALLAIVRRNGFADPVGTVDFEVPWRGRCFVLTPAPGAADGA